MTFYDNEPIFAWFGGIREGESDSSIYIQYKNNVYSFGTNTNIPYWNPVLFNIQDQVFLAYKIGVFCDRWQSLIINITDMDFDNISKKPNFIIPAGLNFCVKTKPIVVDNLVYCGSSVETIFDWSSYEEIYTYNDNKFEFYHRSNPLTAPKKTYKTYNGYKRNTLGLIQPSLWMDNNSVRHAFFRSSQGLGKIYYAKIKEGTDNKEWTEPQSTQFDNPNSGIDTIYNGRLFLVYNPDERQRSPLVISELDMDHHIVDSMVIKKEIPQKDVEFTGELSYPFMVEHDDNIHLTYTHGRTKIEYCIIEK